MLVSPGETHGNDNGLLRRILLCRSRVHGTYCEDRDYHFALRPFRLSLTRFADPGEVSEASSTAWKETGVPSDGDPPQPQIEESAKQLKP